LTGADVQVEEQGQQHNYFNISKEDGKLHSATRVNAGSHETWLLGDVSWV
jgi:hypothetical protein